MPNKLMIIISVLICTTLPVKAQESRKGLTYGLEWKSLVATEVTMGDVDEDYIADGTYGKSLKIYLGYHVSKNIALSLGFGADRYEQMSGNTLPLSTRFKYYISEKQNSTYVAIEGGIQLVFSAATEKGFMQSIVVGHSFPILKKMNLDLMIGYNRQKSFGVIEDNINVSRNSLLLGFGITF